MPLGIEITLAGVLVVVGWLSSLLVASLFALRVIPELAARRMCKAFGLAKVRLKNGQEIYVPVDLEGNPVQIPVGVTTNAEGEQVPQLGYAPLPMTLTYLAAQQAATLVHMKLLNFKSQMSKRMNKEGLAEAIKEGGGLDAMMPFVPKKALPWIAALRAFGIGSHASTGTVGTPETRHGGGGKAI